MVYIKNLKSLELVEFNGIIAIQSNNSNKLLASLFQYELENQETIFQIEGNDISIKNAMIIDNLTRLSDLYTFSTKNILSKMILGNEKLEYNNFINIPYLVSEFEAINDKISKNFLNINFDKSKLFKSLLDINQDIFIDKDNFDKWLDNYGSDSLSKSVIILNNLDFANFQYLEKYLNKFYFIIFTSNIFQLAANFEQLEQCAIVENNRGIYINSGIAIHNWIENKKNTSLEMKESYELLKNDEIIQIELKKYLIK
ncbi:hypothetical protein HGG64_00090 [Mycoplasma phocoeninasale]|uniref:Uncharacterized protein n=1 Tax=Mycoplasma phocoeninasale TaxID=2726117 RepID=A0A858U4E1_9MOLU|nr:hypothetical protein [Mycoplasma phocoeninasale]QJG66135.1 hypothetical protein HGG64_00090 [Mycoplasma phocoeninasale]